VHTKGSETRVELSPGNEILSLATVTPGSGLLFRKDLVHEAMPMVDGSKEIIMLDLLATRKDAGTIVLVTFPNVSCSQCWTCGSFAGTLVFVYNWSSCVWYMVGLEFSAQFAWPPGHTCYCYSNVMLTIILSLPGGYRH